MITYIIFTITFLSANDVIELQLANILSWICAVLFAYITNRKYVFKSKNKNIKKEFTKFISSRVSTLILDMFLMLLFVTLLKFNDKIAKIIIQILVVIGNYIISKLIVFKK